MSFKERHLLQEGAMDWLNRNKVPLALGVGAIGTGLIAHHFLNDDVAHTTAPPQVAQNNIAAQPQHQDTKDFTKIWNEGLSKIKYKNYDLADNLNPTIEKLKINDNDPQSVFREALQLSPEKREALANYNEHLKTSPYNQKYKPLISWLDEKLKYGGYHPADQNLSSEELMKHLSNNYGDTTFSQNTIRKITELQNPSLYFNNHLESLQNNEGYTRNIKNFERIKEILQYTGDQQEFNRLRSMK
jgi:hypothetical protein